VNNTAPSPDSRRARRWLNRTVASASLSGMKVNAKRCGQILLMVFLLAATTVATYALYLASHDNFHVVSPARVYRSSQMSGSALALVIHKYGIKSILNLQGADARSDRYRAETSTARQFGVQHFDVALSARCEVAVAEMEQILKIIRNAPKPILIHCKVGADRTGLISALYLYAIEGRPVAEANRQLSVCYGHFPHLFWRNTVAMDNSFWRYVNHAAVPPPAVNPN